MRTSFKLLLVVGSFYSGFASAAPMLRDDLQKAAVIFCDESKDDLSSLAIYDAQIELAFVKTSGLKRFAQKFAETNGHRGYSFGTCKDHRQWIVSTPAPQPVVKMNRMRRVLDIHYEVLEASCASIDVDAIEVDKDQPLSLVHEEAPGKLFDRIELKDMRLKIMTLTCHPEDKSKTGPELWALVPLMPAEKITGLNSEAELLEWIQGQRKRSGLPRLEIGAKSLQTLADESAQQKDLHHPHSLLMSRKELLKSQNVELLGENRAVAPSFSGLAQLLWNSPSHRRLLLNPKANAIALNTNQKGDDKLLVMVLAKQ
ncbi:MAG: hypothetical protein H7318_02940 [Oligoflexus sp.]|nr:hypothetical protein [Oligoflexus sp.]